ACGSGNFLYVALRELLDLQKAVIAWAGRRELAEIPLTVSPEQLHGIEINTYAHELAQITAWIGYLQWRNENGFGEIEDPVLQPLNNIKHMDAILVNGKDGKPIEPEWPVTDVIIGNPPFLGTKRMRGELGQEYVKSLHSLYGARIPGFSDLVCYWFEKARTAIELNKAKRAGLIATNSIRQGENRRVLESIKSTGDIFLAYSDEPWMLDGAAVRISMVGFDDGSEQAKFLNGSKVSQINAELTAGSFVVGDAQQLAENSELAFMGAVKGGSFDIPEELAKVMLAGDESSPNRSNREVIKPTANATDITGRWRNYWIIDFGTDATMAEAQQFVEPFTYVEQIVKPEREKGKPTRSEWWLHMRPGKSMRQAINPLARYIATPAHSKHRVFVWFSNSILSTHAIVIVAREDDYFFGVLHSKLHEQWALRLGTSLEDRPRYTPTTSFQTFPFPWSPGQEPAEAEDERVAEIAHWARELVKWRDAWLNPPREGMYAGLGTAYDKMLNKRTLTNLYNGLVYYRETVKAGELFLKPEFDKVTRKSVSRAEIQELDDIHTALDHAVLDAYGWPHNLTDQQILERLLALNHERANGT
ncbi:MAG: class I SAM-dependent DNA methyltransferase, partial [Anaerolineales bacterium]|nr:class I SAM-dependent DNA methyltransferase [Anaerolineales bacterium]